VRKMIPSSSTGSTTQTRWISSQRTTTTTSDPWMQCSPSVQQCPSLQVGYLGWLEVLPVDEIIGQIVTSKVCCDSGVWQGGHHHDSFPCGYSEEDDVRECWAGKVSWECFFQISSQQKAFSQVLVVCLVDEGDITAGHNIYLLWWQDKRILEYIQIDRR
jgi:hypothetical protein